MDAAARSDQWRIASRWQEFEGEARSNLIRLFAIAAFYAIELYNYHYGLAGVDRRFHSVITALVIAWTCVGWAVHTCLSRRIFPERLKFLSTCSDLLILTCVLLICNGPQSPLIACYFIILCIAALRFDLNLVRMATAGSVLGYLTLVGSARWLTPALRVPRYFEAIFVVALLVCGIALGQIVRRARDLAEDYAARLGARDDG